MDLDVPKDTHAEPTDPGTNETPTPEPERQSKVFINTDEMLLEILSAAPTAYVNIPLSKKRPSSFELQKTPTSAKFFNTGGKKAKKDEEEPTADGLILEAQDCLVRAANLLRNQPGRQTQLLDLIGIFRSYTADGELPTARNVLAIHTKALEKVIRRVEKATTPSAGQQPQPQNTQPRGQSHPGGNPTTSPNNSQPPPKPTGDALLRL